MVIRLVQDIRKALENELYFVALNSALTLPDICGKAARPTEKCNKKRYILWYDEEIGKYEKNPDDKMDMPYLSGKVIYDLRCCLLHEGNPNINDKKININHFSLVVEKNKNFNSYCDASKIIEFENEKIREYRMDVRRICMILCDMAESYYRNNMDNFHFNYEIIDWDRVTSYLPQIDLEKTLTEWIKRDEKFYQGGKVGENE